MHMVDSITLVKIHSQPQKFWDLKFKKTVAPTNPKIIEFEQ